MILRQRPCYQKEADRLLNRLLTKSGKSGYTHTHSNIDLLTYIRGPFISWGDFIIVLRGRFGWCVFFLFIQLKICLLAVVFVSVTNNGFEYTTINFFV